MVTSICDMVICIALLWGPSVVVLIIAHYSRRD